MGRERHPSDQRSLSMKSFFPSAAQRLAPLLHFSSILLQEPEHSSPPAQGGVPGSRAWEFSRTTGAAGAAGWEAPAGPRFPSLRVPAGASGRRWFPARRLQGGEAQAGVRIPARRRTADFPGSLGRLRPRGPGRGAPGVPRRPHPQRRAGASAGGRGWRMGAAEAPPPDVTLGQWQRGLRMDEVSAVVSGMECVSNIQNRVTFGDRTRRSAAIAANGSAARGRHSPAEDAPPPSPSRRRSLQLSPAGPSRVPGPARRAQE